MKIRTNVKAGRIALNHNESLVRVRTNVKAGALSMNHNQTMVRTARH